MDLNTIVAVFADPKFIAFAAPILVAGVKKAVAVLPSWSLPLLSVVLGAVCATIGDGGVSTDAVTAGAAAGLAGIGVREAFDQVRKNVVKA